MDVGAPGRTYANVSGHSGNCSGALIRVSNLVILIIGLLIQRLLAFCLARVAVNIPSFADIIYLVTQASLYALTCSFPKWI